MVYKGHSSAASSLTLFFLESFRFQGALMAAGEQLTMPVGLTAARWQVLSSVARASKPETVANIGRIMGMTRQGVRRIVTELEAAGLVWLAPNLHHKRASLVCLTDAGTEAFESITERQVPWANALAAQVDEKTIDEARVLIVKLTELLAKGAEFQARAVLPPVQPDSAIRSQSKQAV